MNILLSRTDSIGDVVLTLPLAGLIKEKYPESRIIFLGRTYTKEVIKLSQHIDAFENWDDYQSAEKEQVKKLSATGADYFIHVFPVPGIARLAKKAKISNRIGTSHRIYHWFTCNRLISFSRRKSELHEAQLNCTLLKPLKISIPEKEHLIRYYGLRKPMTGSEKIKELLDNNLSNVVLHPKSKGSAREWGLENFSRLIRLLPSDKFRIFISGTTDEAKLMSVFLEENRTRVTNITGRFPLSEFITLLDNTDAIVAASTGPLHIAAALGTLAAGIYPPIRPMHPGRWSPVGKNVKVFVKDAECEKCRKTLECECIQDISPEDVAAFLIDKLCAGKGN